MDADRSARPGPVPADEAVAALLRLYDGALPEVYGYLLRRCDRREVAEELTSETFLAAADAARRGAAPHIDIGWLIGVARHKLADHWRRRVREERTLRVVAAEQASPTDGTDPWEARLDALRAEQTLAAIAPQYRLALTLRYVDDLPVADVAGLLDRTLQATEALLVRAKAAFRTAYAAAEEGAGGHA